MASTKTAAGVAAYPLEGLVSLFSEKHVPDEERGGCACGFVAWSVAHVAVMAYREAVDHGEPRANYFDALRSMDPSPRLLNAIEKAERSTEWHAPGSECRASLALRWGSAECDYAAGHEGLHAQRASGRTWTTAQADESWDADE